MEYFKNEHTTLYYGDSYKLIAEGLIGRFNKIITSTPYSQTQIDYSVERLKRVQQKLF